jgi:flagellar hook-basal body complex protein FliE
MSIAPIQPIVSPELATGVGGVGGVEHTATDAAEKFAKGDPAMGIHEVVIASEKANIAVRYATTLKNKALEAYRELMNTQV